MVWEKFWAKKNWSHGTPLGYLGPLFHRDVRLGACWLQILFIWGPYDPPGLVAPQVNAKILKTLGSWCEFNINWGGFFQNVSRDYIDFTCRPFPIETLHSCAHSVKVICGGKSSKRHLHDASCSCHATPLTYNLSLSFTLAVILL